MPRKRCALGLVLLLLSATSCGTASDISGEPVSDTGITEQTTTAVQESETDTAAAETTKATAGEVLTGSYTAAKPSETVTLTNHMTEFERACVIKRPFSLLDDAPPAPAVQIGTVNVTKEAQTALYQTMADRGQLTDEELQQEIADAEEYSYPAALMNGVFYNYYIPPDGYDGGRIDWKNGVSFDDMEACIADAEAGYCKDCNMNHAQTATFQKEMHDVFDAVINGTYTKLPEHNKDFTVLFNFDDPYADYRSSWEFDRDALTEIKDSIEEYLIYDEQLCIPFLVHVTLPPDYDAAKTYPVFLMTDGVWRLNDHAALYQAMEQGEAAGVILVSLAYSYNIKGTEDQFRDKLFIVEREKLLRFITDDLMPYLGEQYSIDYADSTLFGHSMGGVFSHYACFMSDQYENQPFFRYIVGSPALFNLYNENFDLGIADAENDYGYFERNDALSKKLFLCGGSLEDPDYASAYNGYDSLLTGLGKLKDRVDAQKADYTYKLYESHHYQYVPSMLSEFLKAEYPAQ